MESNNLFKNANKNPFLKTENADQQALIAQTPQISKTQQPKKNNIFLIDHTSVKQMSKSSEPILQTEGKRKANSRAYKEMLRKELLQDLNNISEEQGEEEQELSANKKSSALHKSCMRSINQRQKNNIDDIGVDEEIESTFQHSNNAIAVGKQKTANLNDSASRFQSLRQLIHVIATIKNQLKQKYHGTIQESSQKGLTSYEDQKDDFFTGQQNSQFNKKLWISRSKALCPYSRVTNQRAVEQSLKKLEETANYFENVLPSLNQIVGCLSNEPSLISRFFSFSLKKHNIKTYLNDKVMKKADLTLKTLDLVNKIEQLVKDSRTLQKQKLLQKYKQKKQLLNLHSTNMEENKLNFSNLEFLDLDSQSEEDIITEVQIRIFESPKISERFIGSPSLIPQTLRQNTTVDLSKDDKNNSLGCYVFEENQTHQISKNQSQQNDEESIEDFGISVKSQRVHIKNSISLRSAEEHQLFEKYPDNSFEINQDPTIGDNKNFNSKRVEVNLTSSFCLPNNNAQLGKKITKSQMFHTQRTRSFRTRPQNFQTASKVLDLPDRKDQKICLSRADKQVDLKDYFVNKKLRDRKFQNILDEDSTQDRKQRKTNDNSEQGLSPANVDPTFGFLFQTDNHVTTFSKESLIEKQASLKIGSLIEKGLPTFEESNRTSELTELQRAFENSIGSETEQRLKAEKVWKEEAFKLLRVPQKFKGKEQLEKKNTKKEQKSIHIKKVVSDDEQAPNQEQKLPTFQQISQSGTKVEQTVSSKENKAVLPPKPPKQVSSPKQTINIFANSNKPSQQTQLNDKKSESKDQQKELSEKEKTDKLFAQIKPDKNLFRNQNGAGSSQKIQVGFGQGNRFSDASKSNGKEGVGDQSDAKVVNPSNSGANFQSFNPNEMKSVMNAFKTENQPQKNFHSITSNSSPDSANPFNQVNTHQPESAIGNTFESFGPAIMQGMLTQANNALGIQTSSATNGSRSSAVENKPSNPFEVLSQFQQQQNSLSQQAALPNNIFSQMGSNPQGSGPSYIGNASSSQGNNGSTGSINIFSRNTSPQGSSNISTVPSNVPSNYFQPRK